MHLSLSTLLERRVSGITLFSFTRTMSAQGSAMMVIACEHAGHTILNLTFGPEVAGDRALRMVLPIAERANQCMPIQELVTRSYCRPDSSGRLPRGLPSGSVAFMVHDNSGIHFSDTIEAASATQTARSRWCILDVRVANPSRIIPATILVPYAHQPTRLNSELDRTDMLPLWFWQTNGTLGVRINSTTFDCLPDKPTRVEASSLKVAICVSHSASTQHGCRLTICLAQWRNYETVEKQIQLRTKPNPGQARVNVTLRRLAFLIAGAVRNAMSVGFILLLITTMYSEADDVGLRDEQSRSDRLAGQTMEDRDTFGIH